MAKVSLEPYLDQFDPQVPGYLSRLEETISRARGALVDVQFALEHVSDGDGMDTVAKMLLDLNTIRDIHRARAGT